MTTIRNDGLPEVPEMGEIRIPVLLRMSDGSDVQSTGIIDNESLINAINSGAVDVVIEGL